MANRTSNALAGAGRLDEPMSVKQSAYRLFCEALFDGRLRPGQFVSQRELVALLGLSIGALRELLPRLQSEGLLSVMPQRGIQITQIDLPMIRDAFQMRMALEREAVISAVRRLPDDILADERQKHLGVMEEVARAATAEALERSQQIDDGFHNLLISWTQNELLAQAYAVNTIRIRLIKLDRITLTASVLPSAFQDHLAVIEAIGARDVHRAIDAMDRHIANARDRAIAL
ncbi:GntR family transcriptional regulator [Consotaella aegiceratis]|uniref:GntR family transcriptional regulator n=1 Tax=Consotaella aegiceratis TaxID=3097961 RepID=UPI002F3F727F